MTENELTTQFQVLQELADKQLAGQQAQAEAELERNRSEQIIAGACSIVPFPKKLRTAPFRSDLTIEQNSLFVANRYRKKYFSRQWDIKEPSGEVSTHRLTVGKIHKDDEPRGILKQVHQDVFYKLLQIWSADRYGLGTVKGKTYGAFTVSAYSLVKAIRGDDSSSEYRRVQSLLQDMTAIPILVEVERNGEKDRQQFTLLDAVRWDGVKLNSKTLRPNPGGKSEVTIMFSSMVTEGFLDKHVKTLLGESYGSLGGKSQRQRSELARLLYPYLDAQLATKTNFHIKLRSLVERFGLTQHRKMSHRKRQFTPAINALNGKAISSEDYVLKVHLRESTEEDDFVLVAKREPNKQLRLFKEDN